MWWNDFGGNAHRLIWWLLEKGEVKRGWRKEAAKDLGTTSMSIYRAEKELFDRGIVSRIKRGSKVKLVKRAFVSKKNVERDEE